MAVVEEAGMHIVGAKGIVVEALSVIGAPVMRTTMSVTGMLVVRTISESGMRAHPWAPATEAVHVWTGTSLVELVEECGRAILAGLQLLEEVGVKFSFGVL